MDFTLLADRLLQLGAALERRRSPDNQQHFKLVDEAQQAASMLIDAHCYAESVLHRLNKALSEEGSYADRPCALGDLAPGE